VNHGSSLVRIPFARRFVVVASLAVVLGSPSEALAQTGVDTLSARAGTQNSGSNLPVLLDGPVDRLTYRLGPGDELDVAILGEVNEVYRLTVAPEGTLLIPRIGPVALLGLTIDEAQARIRSAVLRYYRSVGVSVGLAQVRSFKVFVVGDVPEPGIRTATSVTRVSELMPTPVGENVQRRNVVLRRASGDSVRVDLARFRQLGDLRHNPTVSAGDVLVVHPLDDAVTVIGGMPYPGSYSFRAGETLAEVLEVANGGTRFAATTGDSIRLSRLVAPGVRSVVTLGLEDAFGETGAALRLEPFDAVFVPGRANHPEQPSVAVVGQVRNPGSYPIRPDTTTIRELVRMAGGFTVEASLVDASLRRAPRLDVTGPQADAEDIPWEALTPDERRVMTVLRSGDGGVVIVDFEQLFVEGRDLYDQTLRDGDVLEVPRRRDEVVVLGAVTRPGIVRYSPGQPMSYFVALAGGFSRRAAGDEVVVYKASNRTQLHWREVTTIEAGDRIIVPYRETRPFLESMQTASAISSLISGMLLTVLAFTQLF